MQLDTIQEEIVKSQEQNIIVSAGAGSGKTRVLTERIRHLINSGVPAVNIVAITFTNNAADEMKERLEDISTIGDAFIGTIHAFANRIYKNSDVQYDILDASKQEEIVRYLIYKYAKTVTINDYSNYLDIQDRIIKGEMDEDVISEIFPPSILTELSYLLGNKIDTRAYPENLYSVAEDRHLITFDQLLKEATDYFESINGSLDYLLVDELQDIGNAEFKFLIKLNAANNFFVGDDWQSIYGFKGGNVSIFKNLMNNPNWKSYTLANNYRNSKNIISIGTTVIQQVDDIIQKKINPMNPNKGSVEVSSKSKLYSYLNKVIEDSNYKDWAILCRSNKEIVELSKILENFEIPYTSFKRGNATFKEITLQTSLDQVKLLTVHTAKGLEFKNVILYGNFPIYQKSYLKNDEERKVMYVGITRAIDKLVILN